MRQFLRLFVVLGVCCVVINGRVAPEVQDGRYSRSLKGILKNLKEQPRLPDSVEVESKEEANSNSGPSYSLDISGKEEPVVFEETRAKGVTDGEEQTTISTIGDDAGTVSRDDLSRDDIGNDDIDSDGCNEGDVMRVSCNTCVCSSGKYFCSKRDCKDKEIPLPPSQKSSHKRKGSIHYYNHRTKTAVGFRNDTADSVEENQFSTPNVTSIEETSTVAISQCIDGRTKPVDCNQCVCALGRWACTKQSCIALTLREKASFSGGSFLSKAETLKESLNMDEDCMEGETKKLGCNQCVCHQNSWACSDFTCPATELPSVIPDTAESCQTEEDVKSKECNICSCRRGVWVCTNNDCKKFGNRYYHPVSQKHTSNENDQD